MALSLKEQINQLKQDISKLEEQRAILGDEAVDTLLLPSRQKLAYLEALVDSQEEEQTDILQRKGKMVTLKYLNVVDSTSVTQQLDPKDDLEMVKNAILSQHISEPCAENGMSKHSWSDVDI